jgi:hypothetical protein
VLELRRLDSHIRQAEERNEGTLMKKFVLAVALAAGTVLGLSAAQAAPVSSTASGVQGQVSGDAVKVYHCRHWSGGWHCGGGGGWGHGRHWSHRRHGSWHY